MRKLLISTLLLTSAVSGAYAQGSVYTQRQYLSGRGSDDMVQWDFYCTGGNNSGKWTKIGVPSCWELQGFGTYQYGMKFYGKAFPDGVADEKGMYKYEFTLPEEWANHHIDLVFEGSMTDTQVMINKRKAGDLHQGAFYRITYDVTDRVFFGDKKNLLEVTVSKESANAGVNLAERRADYWNFGGIFRPVFIVCKPAINIERTAIDAKADGSFNAYVLLNHTLEGAKVRTTISDMDGKKVAENTTNVRTGSDHADVSFNVSNPKLWTAETPNRYQVEFALVDADGKTLHIEKDKFGFRTIETRAGDGLYINGKKVNIRGVNRHSFWPESGRTLNKQLNIADVELIKSMNMNSVRLSHYPADPEFYDACDSLGLYVMSELSGWHGHHETINGQKLIKEMVIRDVNHPCVIWWSNGNEKGWNTELDGEFHKWDIQKRPVLHPQGNYGGYETMHYRSYGESEERFRQVAVREGKAACGYGTAVCPQTAPDRQAAPLPTMPKHLPGAIPIHRHTLLPVPFLQVRMADSRHFSPQRLLLRQAILTPRHLLAEGQSGRDMLPYYLPLPKLPPSVVHQPAERLSAIRWHIPYCAGYLTATAVRKHTPCHLFLLPDSPTNPD